MTTIFITYILPALVLIAGMVDDLRSRKIHNKLILILGAVSLVLVLLFNGLQGLILGAALSLLSLCLTAPMVLLKVIGGGDMKLLAVLALSLNPKMLVLTFVLSFFWGASLGLIKTFLDKKMDILKVNLMFLLKFNKPSADTLNAFPFSIALFLGWLSAHWF